MKKQGDTWRYDICILYTDTVYILYNLVCSENRGVSCGKPSKDHPQFRVLIGYTAGSAQLG